MARQRNNGEFDGPQGQGPGGGMIPYGMPILIRETMQQQPAANTEHRHAEAPPVRIQMALEYLQFTAQKQAKREVVAEAIIEIIDGQKLTDDELLTSDVAAQALRQYFDGTLKPNLWESADLNILPTMRIGCICVANGQPNQHCSLCGGKGNMEIVVRPSENPSVTMRAVQPEATETKPSRKTPRE